MENRVIQAVLLSLAVLFLYQTFLVPRSEPPVTGAPTSTVATPAPGTPAANLSATPPAAGQAVAGTPATSEVPAPLVAAERDERIVVTTPHVRAEFSTRGAVLV